MKRIAGVLVIAVCALPAFAQKKKVVNNHIKSMVVYEQKLDKGKEINQKDSEVKYDESGNVIEEAEYKDGREVKRTTYEYDASGNKIRETELDSNRKPVKIIEYRYDGDLRTERSVYNGNKKLVSKKTYKYETY